MNWRVKSLIQKALCHVPAGEQLHYRLQRRGGGLADISRECSSKIDDWRLMVGHMRTVEQPFTGAVHFEVGSGWYPALPMCSYLCGVEKVYTYDVRRHQRPELVAAAVPVIGDRLDDIAELADVSRREVNRRYDHLAAAVRDGRDVLAATEGAVHYVAPADARHTGLPDNSVDWSFSNTVLQHVPDPAVPELMRESMRVLRPGKFMYHSVNCGDNYAYNDPSITQLNYLQFSAAEWNLLWQNDFLYQNRLRAVDFITMAEAEGFDVVLEHSEVSERNMDWLRDISVHPEFANRYTPEELCITTMDMVAKKPAA